MEKIMHFLWSCFSLHNLYKHGEDADEHIFFFFDDGDNVAKVGEWAQVLTQSDFFKQLLLGSSLLCLAYR
jgi:hypothetical protein